jgi:hypothetical protein
MVVYIGGSINSGPLDQTDLKGRYRCNQGGSGELTYEAEVDSWPPQVDRPVGGAGRLGSHLGFVMEGCLLVF